MDARHFMTAYDRLYDKRIFIQKKMRRKRYKKKSLRVMKRYLTLKEYLFVRYFYKQLVKFGWIEQNNTKHFLKYFFKLTMTNLHFREYYLGAKTSHLYKDIKEKCYFAGDERLVLDKIVLDMIMKES